MQQTAHQNLNWRKYEHLHFEHILIFNDKLYNRQLNFGQFNELLFKILSSGSLGLGVNEECSKLPFRMWTEGHMSISTLNSYCSPKGSSTNIDWTLVNYIYYFLKVLSSEVDPLAQGSSKNASNCPSECELKDIWASTLWTHIVYRGLKL